MKMETKPIKKTIENQRRRSCLLGLPQSLIGSVSKNHAAKSTLKIQAQSQNSSYQCIEFYKSTLVLQAVLMLDP